LSSRPSRRTALVMTGLSIIVEPNEIFRQGLIRVLSQAGCKECLGFESSEEMEKVAEPSWSDSLFLVNFGQEVGSVARGVALLKVRRPRSRVVVLSEDYSHRQILEAIKAGASGYVLASMSGKALVKSLEVIALGEHVIPGQALQLLMAGAGGDIGLAIRATSRRSCAPVGLLSARELEVLGCMSQGMSNKLIAREWSISEATVKVHVKAILRKIRVKNRTEAALWAREHGISAGGMLHGNGSVHNGNGAGSAAS
jgi:two-component system nitrate/nitrite response regulator NarL